MEIDLLSIDTSFIESGVLKSPTIIILLSISPFNALNIFFRYMDSFLVGVYLFIIAIFLRELILYLLYNLLPFLLKQFLT